MTDLLLRTTHVLSLALVFSWGATTVHAAMPLRQEPAPKDRKSAADLKRESADLQRVVDELKKVISENERQTSELRRGLTDALTTIESLKTQLAEAEANSSVVREKLYTVEAAKNQNEAALEARKRQLLELREGYEAVQDLQEERDNLERQVKDLQTQAAAAGATIEALDKKARECSAALQQCATDLQQCKSDLERALTESADWKVKYGNAASELAEAKVKVGALESDLAKVRGELGDETKLAEQLAAKVQELELELNQLLAVNTSLSAANSLLSLTRLIAIVLFGLSGLVLLWLWWRWMRGRFPFAVSQGPNALSTAMLAAERHLDRCTSELARSLASRDPNGEQEWLRAARRSHRIREAMAGAARLPGDGVDEHIRRAVELTCGLAADERPESSKCAFELCKALHQHGVALLPERNRAVCDATKGRAAVLMAESFRQVMEAQQATVEQRKECLAWAEWALARANDWFETKDDAPVHLERARLNLQQAQAELDQSKKIQLLRAAKDQAELCIKSLRPAGFTAAPGAGQTPPPTPGVTPVPGPIGEAHLVWLDTVLRLLHPQGLDETERQHHLRWANELGQLYCGDQEFRAVVAWRLAQIREACSDVQGAAAAWAAAANSSFQWSDFSFGTLAFSPKGEYGAHCLSTLCRRELTQIDTRRRPDPLQLVPDASEVEPAVSDEHLVRNWRKALRVDVMRLASLKEWTSVGGRLAGQVQLEALPSVWSALKQRSLDDLSSLRIVGTWTSGEVRAVTEALALLDGPSAEPVDPRPVPNGVAVSPNLVLFKDPTQPTGSSVLLVDFSCTEPESRHGWQVEFEQRREIKHIGLFGNELGVVSLTSPPCLYTHPLGLRGVRLALIDLSSSSASQSLDLVVRQGAPANVLDLQGLTPPAQPSVSVRLRLDQLGVALPVQLQRWTRDEIIRFADRFQRLMWALLAMSPEPDLQAVDAMATSLARDLKFDGEQLKRDCFTIDEYERPAVAKRHQEFAQEFRAVVQNADCMSLWQQVIATRSNALDVIRRLFSRPEFATLRSAALRVGLPVDARPDGEFGKAIGSAVPGGEFLVQFGEGATAVNQSCVLEGSVTIGRANVMPGDWVRVVGADGAPRRVQLCPTAPGRGSCGIVVSLHGASVQVRFDGHYQNFSEVTCRPEGAPTASFTAGTTVEVIESGDQPRVTLRQAPVQPAPMPPIGSVSGWADWFAECKRFLMARVGHHPHGGDADPPSNGDVAAFIRDLRRQAYGPNTEVVARAQSLEQQGLDLSRRHPPL